MSDESSDSKGTESGANRVVPAASKILERLGEIGLAGERKALSLFILSLFTCYFLLLCLVVRSELPEWFPAFTAMFAMYAITFFGVAAGWFWGRWVAIGLGYWGATIAMWGVVSARSLEPALVILGVSHALFALLLSGKSMAAHYEGRLEWRARFHLDEEGVSRLRKTVTRTASSMPALVLFALAPRQDAGGAALLACAAIGLSMLLVGRTLELLPLVVAAAGALFLAVGPVGLHMAPLDTHGFFAVPMGDHPQLLGLYAGLMLAASMAPFVGPIGRFLKAR